MTIGHLLVLLLSAAAATATADEIVLRSTSSTSLQQRESIRFVQSQQIGQPRESICARLVAYWQSKGYWDASCDQFGDTVALELGKQLFVRRLIVSGVTPETTGVSFLPIAGEIADCSNRLLSASRDSGYYFAQATLMCIERTGDSLTLHFNLVPGPLLKLGEMSTQSVGNSGAGLPAQFGRELRERPVTDQLLASLESDLKLLDSTQVFDSLHVLPRPGYTEADLVFYLPRRAPLTISGAIGLSPDRSEQVIGSFAAVARDLFGPLRQAQLVIDRPETGRSRLLIGYQQPVFLTGVGTAGFSLQQRVERDQYSQIQIAIDWRTRVQTAATAGLTLFAAHTETEKTADRFSTVGIGLELFAGEMRPQSHFKESSLRTSIRSQRRSQPGATDRQVVYDTRLTAEYRAAAHLTRSYAIRGLIRFDGYTSIERARPASELLFVGGPPYLRGYRTDQFAANRYGTISIEPTLVGSDAQLFLFLDAAVIRPDNQPTLPIAYSYGIGVRFGSAERQLHLTFGWASGAPLSNLRISAAIAGSF